MILIYYLLNIMQSSIYNSTIKVYIRIIFNLYIKIKYYPLQYEDSIIEFNYS